MLFEEIAESEFALSFVKAKQAKIEKSLNISRLDTLVASWVVYEFVLKHRAEFESAFKECIDIYRSDVLLQEVLDALEQAKERGVKLHTDIPLWINKVHFVA